MVSFITYDLIFLVLFTLAVTLFLYTKRHNLKRQGLLYLYRTKVGIRFIEWTSRKFPKTLKASQYLIVTSGYILMATMSYMIVKFSYVYITSPTIAKAIKIPVIIPLVPYLPRIFNLDFLPPFYFTYWIIILAIIAVPHEFAHGIFARLNKIRIHSTGFGFLGPFLAAFVEPDEKQMEKAKKFPQLSILAAGTFANILFTIIFALIFWLFFISIFTPAGAIFNTYAANIIPISGIDSIDNNKINSLDEMHSLINLDNKFTEVEINGSKLYINSNQLIYAIENNVELIPAAMDSPAFRAELSGAITQIDDKKITNLEELRETLQTYSPGDKITIKTIKDEATKDYKIELEELDGKAFLGIGVIQPQQKGAFMSKIYVIISKIKDPFTYYESSIGNLGIFIYNLLWWIVLINISVALVNMLPVGIFDGGRFFYLTVWGLTGSKKIGERAFKFSTYFMLFLIVALMVKWILIFV